MSLQRIVVAIVSKPPPPENGDRGSTPPKSKRGPKRKGRGKRKSKHGRRKRSGDIITETPPPWFRQTGFWEIQDFNLSRKMSTFVIYFVLQNARIPWETVHKKKSNLFKKQCFFALVARQNLSFYVLLLSKMLRILMSHRTPPWFAGFGLRRGREVLWWYHLIKGRRFKNAQDPCNSRWIQCRAQIRIWSVLGRTQQGSQKISQTQNTKPVLDWPCWFLIELKYCLRFWD
jgi:hypothetical protein